MISAMCQKIPYTNRTAARRAARAQARLHSTLPMLTYRCRQCDGCVWHLTCGHNPARKLPPKIPEVEDGPHRPLINDWYRCHLKQIRKQNRPARRRGNELLKRS